MIDNEDADKELFDRIADSYIEKDLIAYSRACRKLRLFSTLKNVARPIKCLLEVGCGGGFTATYLKGQYQKPI